jgi:protein TonB
MEQHIPSQGTTSYRPHIVTLWAGIAALIAGCASKPPPAPVVEAPPVAPPVAVVPPPEPTPSHISVAPTPRDYRRDAAMHLYAHNTARIYTGKLPPLLYAVGVLQVDIDGRGRVTEIRWMRSPDHAPEVVAEIERSVRAAAPYPAPVRMGRVTYTDTWLWHKSGRFQLDTLTEGQL